MVLTQGVEVRYENVWDEKTDLSLLLLLLFCF